MNLRPIVRGKKKSSVEFGAKLDISVVDGFTRLDKHSFDAYNESELLEEEIENYRKRYGFYPERVLTKRKFGMGLIRTYLQTTSKTVIALSILALNLSKVFARAFFGYMVVCLQVIFFTNYRENAAFV